MKQIIQNTRHRLATLLLLVVAMIIPQVANAVGTQPSGSGTNASPYQIATAANLLWFADQVNNVHNTSICAKLTADITLSGSTDNYVIGTKDYGFKGEFDGNGHTISGVNVTTTKTGNNGYQYAGGLFGCIKASTSETAVVKNLTVAGAVNVTGLATVYYLGGVIGIAYGNVNISNVTSRVNLTTTSNDKDAHCGGIVGSVEWFSNGEYKGDLTVSNCVNYGTLNVSCGEICGGIVGYIRNGSISDCLNVGDISNSQDGYTAGILGYVNSTGCTMTRCLNVGTVTNTHTAANAYSVYYKKSIGTISDLYYKSGVGGTPDAATAITAANLKNGSLGYTFASKGWGQSIGNNSVNDAYPIPNKADYKVYQTGSNYYNNITSTIPTGDFTTTIETAAQYISNQTRIGDTKSFTVTANAGKYITTVKHNGTTLTASNVSNNVKTYSYTVGLANTFSISTASIEYTKPTGSDFTTNLPDNLNNKVIGSTVQFTVTPSTGREISNVYFNDRAITASSTDADGTKHYAFTVAEKNTFTITVTPKMVGDSYEIIDADGLYWFASQVNNGNIYINAKLAADIVVNKNLIDADGNLTQSYVPRSWTPIGVDADNQRYEGTFDGQGHTISGLYYSVAAGERVGLFRATGSSGKIKNVRLIDSYFSGYRYVSGICSCNSGIVDACFNAAICRAQNFTSGSQSEYVGGIVAWNAGTISHCHNAGVVYGKTYVGGICGNNDKRPEYGIITDCYNTGVVYATMLGAYLGGICAVNHGYIYNCYNAGSRIDEQAGNYGAICGLNGATVINSYYLEGSAVTGIYRETSGVYISESIEKTATHFASGEVAWLLNNSEAGTNSVWRQTIGVDDFPVLDNTHGIVYHGYDACTPIYNNTPISIIQPQHPAFDHNGFCTNCGGLQSATLVNGTYAIANAGQLYWFAEQVNNGNINYNAKLTADIVVNQNVLDVEGNLNGDGAGLKIWTPIGTDADGKRFNGTFDGQGHTVSGLYFDDDRKPAVAVALFGAIDSDGKIKNVGVIDSYICAYDYVAGICGINNGTVENCFSAASCKGYTRLDESLIATVAGIVSQTNSTGIIQNCYNIGRIFESLYHAAVCGSNDGYRITNCYYLKGTAAGGIAKGSGSPIEMSTEQFASGEVAWLLNGKTANGDVAWYQNLSENADAFPVLDSTHRKVYYGYDLCKLIYSNEELSATSAEHSYDTDGFCIVCDAAHPASQDADGNYEISDAGHLYWFAEQVNSVKATINAKLTADIIVNENVLDADGNLYGNGSGFRTWTPIGKDEKGKRYEGTFDGQGHTVSGLYFNSKQYQIGLFGCLDSNGLIQNVGVHDSYFLGSSSVGGVCGYNRGGSISNCYNSATIGGYLSLGSAGGVCGYNTGTLTNCYNTANITDIVATLSIGGMCGFNEGTISKCHNTGLITGGDSKSGSVCGYNSEGSITNCYYLNGTAERIVGSISTGTVDATAMTADELASGEVAWLLNGSEAGENPTWRQTIGEDKYPVLDTKQGIVIYSTPTGLNSVIRPTAGTLVGAADVYNFAGIDGKKVYGIEHTGTLAAEHPYVFTTNNDYVSFVPSDEEVTDDTETCGLTGVLDPDGVKVYGKDDSDDTPVSIVFTATALKYANPKGNTVKYGKCYINAEECFITSEPVSAMAKSIANFGDGTTTSIDDIEATVGGSEGKTYNLQGVEVGKTYKGIVVVNGKKMVRK